MCEELLIEQDVNGACKALAFDQADKDANDADADGHKNKQNLKNLTKIKDEGKVRKVKAVEVKPETSAPEEAENGTGTVGVALTLSDREQIAAMAKQGSFEAQLNQWVYEMSPEVLESNIHEAKKHRRFEVYCQYLLTETGLTEDEVGINHFGAGEPTEDLLDFVGYLQRCYHDDFLEASCQ